MSCERGQTENIVFDGEIGMINNTRNEKITSLHRQ
jgi:hypothetical protein